MAAPDELRDDSVIEEMTGGVVSTAAVPVTEREAVLALELKAVVLAKLPAVGGLNRATTDWLAPAGKVEEAPGAVLDGGGVGGGAGGGAPPKFGAGEGGANGPPDRHGPE